MAYPEEFDDIILEGRSDLLTHPKFRQVALCLHRLESEVNNGGFHQFFSNASGQLVPQTLDALKTVGATQTGELLQRAVDVAFPHGYPKGEEEVESALAEHDAVEDELESLDAGFYEYREPLADLVNAFLGGEA